MDRADYEADICIRLKEARSVPCKHITLPDGSPLPEQCHERVDAWVSVCPGSTPVRGWVVWYPVIGGVKLTAHSVVRDTDGFYDVTIKPPEPNEPRAWQKFVPHTGDDASFNRLRQGGGMSFDCLDCEPT